MKEISALCCRFKFLTCFLLKIVLCTSESQTYSKYLSPKPEFDIGLNETSGLSFEFRINWKRVRQKVIA